MKKASLRIEGGGGRRKKRKKKKTYIVKERKKERKKEGCCRALCKYSSVVEVCLVKASGSRSIPGGYNIFSG